MLKFILGFALTFSAMSGQAGTVTATTEPQQLDSTAYSVNTLYALLVAEVAGQRQLFDLALGNYLLEAHRTQDPGVAERATQIAQYIGAEQAALDASTLWVKLDASNPLAQQALSLELVKAARFSESSLHLQAALDLNPQLDMNFMTVQGVSMSEGSRELWLQSLTPLLSHYNSSQSLLFNVANLHKQQKNNQLALQLIDQLLAQDEGFYGAWTLKARLHASQGEVDNALSATQAALQQFPNDKAFTILKARLLIKKQDIPQARQVFQSLAEEHPRDSHILLPLALTQLELEDFDGAQISLEKLLALGAMQDEAHYYLGRIAQLKDEPQNALKHYLAMAGGREYLAAQGGVVQVYIKLGQTQQALQHIRQQRQQDIQNRQAYFLMEVDLLNRSGQYQASLEVLNDALKAYQNNTDLRYSRAMVSEKLGDIVQLEEDLAFIIDKNPKNATALNALGYTLADRTKRLDEALKLIQQARAIAPSDPAIMDSLGWVYFRLGRMQESLALLKKAYGSFPDAEVAAHLGEVLWAMGLHKEAKEIWHQGIKQQPHSQILLDTLSRLEVNL
ncbi:MAG: tetratricopeptide repeat protein [Bermanella sp.]